MTKRGNWGTRAGFILATIGSAVGLGNIWRFPYMVASNGGGAFVLAYLVALLTAGVPIMILEFSIGHKMRSGAPGAFKKLNKNWEWLGWWQCAISFVIAVYYVAIIAWSLHYAFGSLSLIWGSDTGTYFFNKYLQLSDGPLSLKGIKIHVLIPLLIAWIVNYIVLMGGIKKGIEKANKILMPLLFGMMIIIVIRGLTLPGALAGLDYMFKPDLSQLLNGKLWIAAYGQVFFSLSVAFAIMLTYASYLPEKSDIVNNGFIASFADCSFSLLAGLGVFSILGYMAAQQGVSVGEVAKAGVGLAFVVFPQAINTLPGLNSVFGVIFFLSLAFAGFTSSMSILETFITGIMDKFGTGRKVTVTVCVAIAASVSIFLTTGAGLYILDIVDYFINNYAIVVSGLVEVILIAWVFKLNDIKAHANENSDFKVGIWWDICLKFVTPIMLIIMFALKLKEDLAIPYGNGDYKTSALLILGWSMPLITVIAGIIGMKIKGKEGY